LRCEVMLFCFGKEVCTEGHETEREGMMVIMIAQVDGDSHRSRCLCISPDIQPLEKMLLVDPGDDRVVVTDAVAGAGEDFA
jgi:hypothetical protein